MQRLITHWKAIAALLVVYLVWGTTFGAIKIGTLSLPPGLLVSLRFLTGGSLMLAIALCRRERFPMGAALKRHLMVGFLLFFMGNALVAWSVYAVPTGLGATLVAMNPFWMTWLAAHIAPREKTDPKAFAGLFIGFIGMLILLSPKLLHLHTVSPWFWPGLSGILVMVFFWSFGSVYAKKHPTQDSLMMGIGIQNTFAGSLVGIIYLVMPHPAVVHPSIQSLQALGYLIVMGTMVATPCYLYTVKVLPISLSSTFSYITPLISVGFGCLFLGETLSPVSLLGTLVILGGVIWVQWVNQKALVTPNKSLPPNASSMTHTLSSNPQPKALSLIQR